jgi:hypothetical protein
MYPKPSLVKTGEQHRVERGEGTATDLQPGGVENAKKPRKTMMEISSGRQILV